MTKHKVVTTDAEIEAALERSKALELEPFAQTVEHIQDLNLLIVGLSNRRRLVLPIEDVQGLGEATHEQIQNYELLGRGTGISFPDLDVDLYVPSLIEGVYGNRRWMARLGRKGGRSKTTAKRLASQRNGTKGGRPKTVVAVASLHRPSELAGLLVDLTLELRPTATTAGVVVGKCEARVTGVN